MGTRSESEALLAALVAAYPDYTAAAIAALGVSPTPGLESAVESGSVWLERALVGLLDLPFREQSRGPLEVFQEAMRFPTEALADAGVEPPERDPAAVAALPGDTYGLAPASSADLGEDVWRVHLAWGAAKARALRPSAALLSRDLADRSKVEAAAAASGFRLVVWSAPEDVDLTTERPAMMFVDLEHPGSDEVVTAVSASGIRVIGFGPHVDDLALVRARSLGAADALPRSVFFRRLEGLFPIAT